MDTTQRIMLAVSVLAAVMLVAAGARAGWFGGTAPARSGGRTGPWVHRRVERIEPVVWLIAILVLYLAPFVGAGAVSGLLGDRLGGRTGTAHQAASMAAGYAVAIAVGTTVWWLLRPLLIGAQRPRARWASLPRDLALGALGLLFVAPFYIVVSQAAVGLSQWIHGEPESLIKHDTLARIREQLAPDAPAGAAAWAWVTIAAVTIGAPVVEELTYRLGVQSLVMRLLRGPGGSDHTTAPAGKAVWPAVLITSLVFGAMHLPSVPLSAVPSLVVLSIGLGLAYERTGRLAVPIVMHVLFNMVNIGAVLAGWAG